MIDVTRIRSVERGICPIAAVCTVLFYCLDVKTNIRIATLTLRLHDVLGHLIALFAIHVQFPIRALSELTEI